MTSIIETLNIDMKLLSECCGADVDVDTSTCIKCKKKCDWSFDLEDCDKQVN